MRIDYKGIWFFLLFLFAAGFLSAQEIIENPKKPADSRAGRVISKDEIMRIEEDGRHIIRNPAKPLFGEIDLELKSDLSIGNADDENYLFHRVSHLAVSTDGNIYVADTGGKRIQVFDKHGKYLRRIGREGQGPGEFESPQGVYLGEDLGEVFIPEYRSIEVFQKNGDFLRAVPIESYNRFYSMSPNGIILAEKDIPVFDDKKKIRGYRSSLRLIDNRDGAETEIASFPDQLAKIIEGRSAKFRHGYEHRLQMCAMDGEAFIYGFSSHYRLYVIDGTGISLSMIEKESPPLPISEREKEAVRKRFRDSPIKNLHNIPFPEHRPHFGPIFSDGDLILVMMFTPPDDDSDARLMDVFDARGRYVYRASLPVMPNAIEDGFIYLVDSTDETGDIKIKRYEITNWKHLKTGIDRWVQ